MLFLPLQNRQRYWLIALLIYASGACAFNVGTYNSPPFSMYEDGEEIGMATEAVQTLLHKSAIEHYTILNYPLARGLEELKAGRIDIYYPYITEFNKKLTTDYILIGPIAKYKIALFVRKNYSQIVSLSAMRESLVGAERGSISASFLQTNNMHIEYATQELSCLRMVLAERITACAMGTLPGMYVAAINNYYDELRYVEIGLQADMYVALSPNLSVETVKNIKHAFTQLKAENYFEKQQHEYEKKFALFIKSLS